MKSAKTICATPIHPIKQDENLFRDSVFGCDGVNLWQTVCFVRPSTPEPDGSVLVLCNHVSHRLAFKPKCALCMPSEEEPVHTLGLLKFYQKRNLVVKRLN